MMDPLKIAVIGGGAAGFFAAVRAAEAAPGARVAIFEATGYVLAKVRISGGGRCNFTNIHARPENYISANPHFCRSALSRYRPADFIALAARLGC